MEFDYFFMFLGILAMVLMIHYFVGKMFKKTMEGLTSSADAVATSGSNGLAGNSVGYSSTLAQEVTSLHDQVLIPKYKSNYDTILLEQEELLKLKMLELALSINPSNIEGSLPQIQLMNDLSKAVTSLDLIMTYVDSSKT